MTWALCENVNTTPRNSGGNRGLQYCIWHGGPGRVMIVCRLLPSNGVVLGGGRLRQSPCEKVWMDLLSPEMSQSCNLPVLMQATACDPAYFEVPLFRGSLINGYRRPMASSWEGEGWGSRRAIRFGWTSCHRQYCNMAILQFSCEPQLAILHTPRYRCSGGS